jgi:hypothetical protein
MGVTTEAWTAPPGWRAAFEKQATRDLVDRVTRYARKRGKMIERVGRKVDPLYARELVQDAIGDTLDGRRVWDPERTTLLAHLMAVVHSRTGHEMVRARHLPHRSLDDSADDNSSDGRPLETEASHALARHASVPEELIALHARRAVEALRRASAGDTTMAQLLDAFEHGKVDRRDVMEWSGMSAKTYNNVRHRLMRLVEKLPTELRENVNELLA